MPPFPLRSRLGFAERSAIGLDAGTGWCGTSQIKVCLLRRSFQCILSGGLSSSNSACITAWQADPKQFGERFRCTDNIISPPLDFRNVGQKLCFQMSYDRAASFGGVKTHSRDFAIPTFCWGLSEYPGNTRKQKLRDITYGLAVGKRMETE